ncbi:Leo1-like protein-domain-containing protein [Mycotypha africana]|uniref:Leo1-like protein-domain-containing protein n=1 Tax=Mycotypha africana TaxID=64632 RepID=UPI0023000D41|nr:Leo1-like protein-domain-containing protein [Mycotypha africana]KAI8976992.1 Leo1-like protein-domain-containing protein [Mycotypha africana]
MSEHDFKDLFGSEDEASDIDDGRSQVSANEDQQQQQASPSPLPQATSNISNDENDDLEDLFGGSGSEPEEENDDEHLKRKSPSQKRSRMEEEIADEAVEEAQNRRSSSQDVTSEEEAEEMGEDGYEGEYGAYSSQARKKKRVEIELTMPQLPVPYSDNGKFYLAKLPRFIDIDTNPFDPDEFEVQVPEGLSEVQHHEAIREQIENTIRWRKVKEEDGLEAMQSNAHFVEWEDGRVSLMLGNECFDISSKPMGVQEYTYLLAHQTGAGALESHVEFTDHMSFKPSGLKSDTHRYLTAQIADRQVKKNKTKMFFTEKDPELIKQQLELQEQERLKAQRKLELQRRKADMRYSSSAAGSSRRGDLYMDDYDSMPIHRGGTGNQGRGLDRYEDDFVVDDEDYDEEEERRREDRLAKAKSYRMEKYKRKYSDDDIDEDEEQEEEENEEADYGVQDEDDDDEVVVRRPNKQRRVFSDEDD